MKVIDNEHTVFVDVDGTLILPYDTNYDIVKVKDPVTGNYLKFRPHHAMIRLLIEEAARGSYIVVWSRGGNQWARAVIEGLMLESHVDVVMTKPMVYFDDVDIKEWLPYRVFFEPGYNYKQDIEQKRK